METRRQISWFWDGRFTILTLLSCFCLATGAQAVPQVAGPEPTTPQAYWVFFRDRGDLRLDSAELLHRAEAIPPEVWARRLRNGAAALPDPRDEPLWDPYVQQVSHLGRLRHQSRWLNAVSVELSPGAMTLARGLPFVAEVRPVAVGKTQGFGPSLAPDDTPLETTLPLKARLPQPSGIYGPAEGQLQEIGVPAAHALGYTGNRVLFMMIDAGFRKDHHAFAHTNRLAERDFVFHDGNTQNEPADVPGQHFHGTGTWAVAGGYDPGNIVGPAYGATFVLAKTENIASETEVEEDNYVAALEWADSLGVVLTSASLGYTCFDDGFCYSFPLKDGDTPVISRALDIAASRGILCVNSAGNYGSNPMSLGTPADADSMVAVGAVDSLDQIANFSSRGPSDDGRTKPEVVARGVMTWWADASDVSTYGYASGTSLSCPLVSGACALLLEAHPEWSNMQARAALMATADHHTAPDNNVGWGRINLAGALLWTPVVFPVPFSLLAPADSGTVTTFAPTFSWRASHDPDHGATLQYTLKLRDTAPGGSQWSVPAGADTSCTVPFALNASATYSWEVQAEDPDLHRRTSRESFLFHTPGQTSVPGAGATPLAMSEVSLGPNPFVDAIQFRIRTTGNFLPPTALLWAVYDAAGRRVAASSAPARGGAIAASWNGADMTGKPVPAGVYYLELRLGPAFARRTLVRLAPGAEH